MKTFPQLTPTLFQPRSSLVALSSAVLLLSACGSGSTGPDGSTMGAATGGNAQVVGTGAMPGLETGGAGGSGGAFGSTGGALPQGGAGGQGGAMSGGGVGPGTGGAGGTVAGVGGMAAAGGSTGTGGSHNSDHCISGYDPHPTDASMSDELALYEENGQTDVTVQPEVIQWMEENIWQEAHFQWHQVRRCGGFVFGDAGDLRPCEMPELLPESNECEDGQDGYEFLVMHRHMIQSLKQLWPNHTEQFEGWDEFPDSLDYPEVLRAYYSDWDAAVRSDAAIADDIENNLDMFADEGEFGQWIQCGSLGGGLSTGSLHASLHFNGYPQQNQSHSVANQRRNLDSYVFWKLHGWIDNVWERYRIAKGQQPDEAKLKDEMIAQCREMDTLAALIDPSIIDDPGGPDLNESGFFHDVVRPGLEAAGCATCHGAGEDAGLRLGFEVSSTEIVERLVDANSAYASGYKLVVPGDPDSSWLYLKASGDSVTSGVSCAGVMNCEQAMPPGIGMDLPASDLANLRQWIADGAPAPTVTD